MQDVVCLSSDTDDDIGAEQLLKGLGGSLAVDSDDDQPLEALKQQLKVKSSSICGSQATGSQGGVAASQGAAPAKAATAEAAAGQALPHTQRGKENALGSLREDAAVGAVDDCDLDNWTLEPLAKRVRRGTGRRGAAAAAPAAAAGSGGDTAGGSSAAQVGNSSGQLWRQQQQQQYSNHLQEPVSRHNSQDSWQHVSSAAAAAAAAAAGGSPPGAPAAAAAAPSRKRQQRAASSSHLSSHDADSAEDWSPEEAAAAAAAAADDDADADMSDDEADEALRGRSSSRGRGRGRGGARAASGSGKVRMTAEERAAQRAEQKARKEAEKVAAKIRRQEEQQAKKDEVAAVKAAKKFETFATRKQNGSFCEYESVLVMDAATSRAALGLALSAELDRRKTMCWQIVPQLPLSGRWPGCSCFCFKRRKMCEADEHASKTAATTQLQSFPEDATPPYVQLVFETPGAFFTELTRDSLAGLMAAVAAAHPDTTLGVLVLGLKSHVQRIDNQSMRQGTASQWDWRRVQQQLLNVHLSTPGLQLRLLSKLEEAATHLINTTRVLGQQPYSSENQLEATGGAGPSQAIKSAAGAMAADLGPNTCSFAVNTLGKMHGMGGNKAWAVAKAYPSFGALIAGFQRAAALPGGRAALLLQDLMEPAGSGKAKPRRVGPAMSKRLHLLLTCEDPDTVVEGGEGDAE